MKSTLLISKIILIGAFTVFFMSISCTNENNPSEPQGIELIVTVDSLLDTDVYVDSISNHIDTLIVEPDSLLEKTIDDFEYSDVRVESAYIKYSEYQYSYSNDSPDDSTNSQTKSVPKELNIDNYFSNKDADWSNYYYGKVYNIDTAKFEDNVLRINYSYNYPVKDMETGEWFFSNTISIYFSDDKQTIDSVYHKRSDWDYARQGHQSGQSEYVFSIIVKNLTYELTDSSMVIEIDGKELEENLIHIDMKYSSSFDWYPSSSSEKKEFEEIIEIPENAFFKVTLEKKRPVFK